MGFMALDLLAKELNVEFREEKTFMSLVASTFINGEKMFLVKPLTFMNESGRAVAPLLKYYNLDPADLTVNHVLSRFDNADKEIAQDGIFKAVDAMKFYIENGDFQQTMNKFN